MLFLRLTNFLLDKYGGGGGGGVTLDMCCCTRFKRGFMQTSFFPYGICILLTGFAFPANAEKVSAPYKLGQAYTSEINNKVKCLEGHSGAIIGNAGCKDFSRGCKSDSDCSGFGALASSSSDGAGYKCSSVTKQCEYQECNNTSVCVKKYSHMRSCVDSGRGVKECRITCNWQKVIESASVTIDTKSIINRMKYEANLWEKFSRTSLDASYFKSGTVISKKMHTCINGSIQPCDQLNFAQDISNANWNGNKVTGYMYRPCMSCSIAMGGTYGIGTDENIPETGAPRWYAVYVDFKSGNFGGDIETEPDNTSLYTDWTWRKYVAYVNSCGSREAVKPGVSVRDRLNSLTPFIADKTEGVIKAKSGLTNTIELGYSFICAMWHTTGKSTRFVDANHSCTDKAKACLQSTAMTQLVYVPRQNVIKYLPTASTPTKGSTYVRHNFNQPNGTLLCCTLRARDEEKAYDENKINKCVVVKY